MPQHKLKSRLKSIDGKDYGAYQSIKGEYAYPDFKLIIHQIPKDPYAPPHTGIYRILVSRNDEEIVTFSGNSKIRQKAFCDFLARKFHQVSGSISAESRGTAYSGLITIIPPGQAILQRNCVHVDEKTIELRCFVGLPADGRKINSKLAETMLLKELPEIVRLSVFSKNIDEAALEQHLKTAEEADYIRGRLDDLGLISFVGNNSILPRASGISDKPMPGSAVPFISPNELEVRIPLPDGTEAAGMGVPQGVTLIVGGGYHGKSTLLQAISAGIFNHVPGDGRERCITDSSAVHIRSAAGRSIVSTDISPFISNLPLNTDTTSFSTENASGSTSQAANIIEAIEAGAKILLLDEDSCAANFMIRDHPMQKLVSKDMEPITVFIDRVRELYESFGISTLLVLGGAGAYFKVADRVIQMHRYRPSDVTARAKSIAASPETGRLKEAKPLEFETPRRKPLGNSVDCLNKYGKRRINAPSLDKIVLGENEVDLSDVGPLKEQSQTLTIGHAIEYAKPLMNGTTTLRAVVEQVARDCSEKGLDVLNEKMTGNFAEFRSMELAFAVNRLRTLKIGPKDS